ncbi:hypothetical protein [Pseudovibrio sp. SPO723]|uniref:hypothetical protein n=1 Tax=Nesiotobacter zosterae TaxID=392721 RepID=UPI0029C5ED9F|nr:hypothetical protein [Pseudovibrio sp. SPO723]MDX5592588.1 hypothetical protein [Pseudovibrio sp. SPO723]
MLSLWPKLKTYAALAGAFFVSVGLVAWRAFVAGKQAEKGQEARERLQASQEAREAENEVSSYSDSAVDHGLSSWVRKR